MREVRITHVTPALFGGDGGVYGGAERYVWELARAMGRHTATSLVTFADRDAVYEREGVRVRVIGGARFVRGQRFNPIHVRALWNELSRAQIVHCHQQHILASSYLALLGRLRGRAVYVTDLGGGGWDISAYINTDRWYRGHLHISRYSRAQAGHNELSRASVILGGVDAERFSRANVARDRVLYVGRQVPHKGIDVLIAGLPAGMPLEIIGHPYDADYAARLRELARGKDVTFREDVSDEQLLDAYRRALCVVLPSVYRDVNGNESRVPELLGQTLLEAMACGAPALCTDVASMPEVVEHGVTGFVVPPNDPNAIREKLEWLRDHPLEAEAMGQAGWRRVRECFDWEQVVARCFAAYGIAQP